MINASKEFKETIYNNANKEYVAKATITLMDNTELEVDSSDIWEGGIEITEQTSSNGKFDIGFCACNQLVLKINNTNGRFSTRDFYNARIRVFVGLILSETTEYVARGVYTVDEPVTSGGYITLTCIDDMHRLDKKINNLSGGNVGQIVNSIANACDVGLATSSFLGHNVPLNIPSDVTDFTYRQALSYVCQAVGSYAYFNQNGLLEIKWYDLEAFEESGNLEDGSFVSSDKYHHIYSLQNIDITTDDVVITGIRVTNEEDTYLYGEEGYVLEIEDNPFTEGREQSIANYVGGKVIGMKFRALNATARSNPLVQAGDPAYVTHKGYSYQCYITNMTFTIGKGISISCDAESYQGRQAEGLSANTKTIIQSRKVAKKEISRYDLAVQQLTNLMTNSFGFFKTKEALEDGSVIYYMHDKPTIPESKTIWKMTANTFTVTTDGGETWNAGMDSNGNAVVNVLDAIGINAEWVNIGNETLEDALTSIGVQFQVLADEITQTAERIEGEVRNEVAEQLRDAEIYTWIKYADDEHGNGISDNPTGKKYVGIATNKKNVEPSNNPSDYEWSRVQGEPGTDGKGIVSTTVTYQNHTSGTTPPTGTWSSTIPTPVEGRYLWTRTITTYTVGDPVTTYSVSYYATDGQKGDSGRGIESTVVTYQLHTNGTTAPTGTWLTSPPTPVKGRYLWTRTVITYTEGSPSTSYSTSYYATDGQKGDKGDSTYTWIKYADDKLGNGMSDSSEDKRYVGIATNKTTPDKSTNPADYEWSPLYDNVEIGGANRLFDSRTNIEFYSNDNLDIQLFRGPGNPYYKVYNPNGSTINLFAAFPNSRFAEPLESLGRVTVSLEVLVDVDRDVKINNATFPVKGNRWTKIYFSKEFGENITKHIRVRNPFSRKRTKDINVGTKLIEQISTNINTLYYRNLQVERGNVPTDHNLTPEELEDKIDRYSSEIKQLADKIVMTVRKNEIISEINQSAEEIKLDANRVSLEGLVTANEHFKILKDGKMVAVDGEFKGTVEANRGEIGGLELFENKLVAKFSKSFGPFTEADTTRLQRILLKLEEPTESDFERYDFSGKRYFDITDLATLAKMEAGALPTPFIVNYEVTINTGEKNSIIQMKSDYTNHTMNLGAGGIYTSGGSFKETHTGKLYIGGYEVRVDDNGNLYTIKV